MTSTPGAFGAELGVDADENDERQEKRPRLDVTGEARQPEGPPGDVRAPASFETELFGSNSNWPEHHDEPVAPEGRRSPPRDEGAAAEGDTGTEAGARGEAAGQTIGGGGPFPHAPVQQWGAEPLAAAPGSSANAIVIDDEEGEGGGGRQQRRPAGPGAADAVVVISDDDEADGAPAQPSGFSGAQPPPPPPLLPAPGAGLASASQQPPAAAGGGAEPPRIDDDESAEATSCIICLDVTSVSGPHRLCSLKCGHVFGRSCVESWIKERGRNAKCPQCNSPTRSADIRNVYASRVLAAVDTSERDAALQQLELERKEKERALAEEAKAKQRAQQAEQELRALKASLDAMRKGKENGGAAAHSLPASSAAGMAAMARAEGSGRLAPALLPSVPSGGRGGSAGPSSQQQWGTFRVSCVIPSSGRALDLFDGMVLVANQAPAGTNHPHTLVKFPALMPQCKGVIRLPQDFGQVRDIRLRATGPGQAPQALVAAASSSSLILASCANNAVVATLPLPEKAWSCAWGLGGTHLAYAGLVNGDVATYDLRSYSQPLACLAATKRQPCHSVLPIPAALGGGVVSASMNAVTDWQGADPTALRGVPLPTVGLAGPCCSVDWEPTGGALLCSLRPAPDGSAPARLQLLSPAETSTGREWVAEHTLTGHSGRAVLSRVAAVPSGRGGGDSLVAAADEGTGCVALWSLRAAASGAAAQVPFRLPPHESPVVDIRVDADAQNRADGAGRFMVSLSGGSLSIYSRDRIAAVGR